MGESSYSEQQFDSEDKKVFEEIERSEYFNPKDAVWYLDAVKCAAHGNYAQAIALATNSTRYVLRRDEDVAKEHRGTYSLILPNGVRADCINYRINPNEIDIEDVMWVLHAAKSASLIERGVRPRHIFDLRPKHVRNYDVTTPRTWFFNGKATKELLKLDVVTAQMFERKGLAGASGLSQEFQSRLDAGKR